MCKLIYPSCLIKLSLTHTQWIAEIRVLFDMLLYLMHLDYMKLDNTDIRFNLLTSH